TRAWAALVLAFGRRALGGAATDHDTGSDPGRCRDQRFVFPLDRRVWDLEHIEDPHGDLVREIGQSTGHADEPDGAGPLELQDGVQGAVLRQLFPRRRAVEL